jgi:hypothetical protein
MAKRTKGCWSETKAIGETVQGRGEPHYLRYKLAESDLSCSSVPLIHPRFLVFALALELEYYSSIFIVRILNDPAAATSQPPTLSGYGLSYLAHRNHSGQGLQGGLLSSMI